MSSIEEIRQKIETGLDHAATFLNEGRIRLADQELESIAADVTDHADEMRDLADSYQSLRREVRNHKLNQIKEIRAFLDRFLNLEPADSDPVHEDEAREQLQTWRGLLPGNPDEDPELGSYYTAVQDKIADVTDYRIAAATDQMVSAKIEEAKRLQRSRRDVPPQQLQALYNDAYEIALKAASANPNNRWLEAIKDRAFQHREQMVNYVALLTSGGQAGEYKKLLAYYESVPDGSDVEYIARGQEFVGKITKEDAIQRTKTEARAYASEKAKEYEQRALVLLDENRPDEALGELSRYRDNQLDTFLEAHERERIQELEVEIQAERHKLRDAESKAEQAIVAANSDGRKAWRFYIEAKQTYAGVVHRPVHDQARRGAILRLQHELRDLIDTLEAQFEREEYRSIVEKTRSAIRSYGDLNIPELYEAIARLESIQSYTETQLTIQTDIINKLTQVKDLLARRQDTETKRASTILKELEQNYDRALLVQIENYVALRSLVNSQLDAEGELQRLRDFVAHEDPLTVERAMRSARDSANLDASNVDQRFVDIAIQLELHLNFLKAARAYSQGQLDTARDFLKPVLEAGNLAPDGAAALDLEDEIREILDQTLMTKVAFESAEMEIAGGNAREAFYHLRDLPTPPTRGERNKLRDLLTAARTQWRREIIEYFSSLTVEHPGTEAEMIEQLLEALRIDLDYPRDAETWGRQLYPVIEAARAEVAESEARLSGRERDYEIALKHWQNILRATGGNPQTRRYVEHRINDINRTIVSTRKTLLLAQAVQAEDTAIPEMVGELATLVDELRGLSQRTGDIIYDIWGIEVTLTQAMLTESPQKRQNLFDSSAQFAQRADLARTVHDDDRLEAERLKYVRIAKKGPEIGRLMSQVERQLGAKKSLEEIQEAVTIWEAQLAIHEADFVTLRNWYAKLRDTVIQDLSTQIDDLQTGLDLKHLQPLAKLLLLGDVRGNTLSSDISRLSARLDEQVEIALSNFRSGRGYEQLTEPNDVITAQIKELEGHLKNVTTIYEILTRFETTFRMESAEDLLQSSLTQSEDLRTAIEQLKTLKRDFDGINTSLAEGSVGKDVVDKTLNGMKAGFPEHPATKNAERQRNTSFETLADLEERIEELARAMQNEDFVYANQLMNGIRAENLVQLRLDGKLGIPDVYTNQVYDHWADVVGLVTMRLRYIEMIRDWAAPFAGDMTPGVIDCNIKSKRGADDEVVNTWVVNWQEVLHRVKQQRHEGEFEAAIQLIQEAAYGEATKQMSLQLAIDQAENPIWVEETQNESIGARVTGDVSYRYRMAIRYAGTRCGAKILQDVQDRCLKLYREQLHEAEKLANGLRELQTRWNNYEKQYKAALRSIAAQLGRKRNRFDRNIVDQDLAQIDAILEAMANISGQNPLLNEMRDHYLINQARKKIGVR